MKRHLGTIAAALAGTSAVFILAFRPTPLADFPVMGAGQNIVMTGTDLAEVAAFADGCPMPATLCEIVDSHLPGFVSEPEQGDPVVRFLIATVFNFNTPIDGTFGDITCAPKPAEGAPLIPIFRGANVKLTVKRYAAPTEEKSCYLDVIQEASN